MSERNTLFFGTKYQMEANDDGIDNCLRCRKVGEQMSVLSDVSGIRIKQVKSSPRQYALGSLESY